MPSSSELMAEQLKRIADSIDSCSSELGELVKVGTNIEDTLCSIDKGIDRMNEKLEDIRREIPSDA